MRTVVTNIPLSALREIEADLPFFLVNATEDEGLRRLEDIAKRHGIAMDDPWQLWIAYLTWTRPIRQGASLGH